MLVSYDSSDDEEPPPKKRKLPSLAPSVVVSVPIDNPALHQGRIRSAPHVDGQWACHLYICIKLEKSDPLYCLISQVLDSARQRVPILVDFFTDDLLELHVSLSRPIYIRSHQREDLKRSVKALATKSHPFKLSFSGFTELVNDEKTRTFLAIEVGAGHHELNALSVALTPTLQAFRQKEYYAEPRFHASIAWALLATTADQKFETIAQFPDDLVPSLNDSFRERLVQKSVGCFDAQDITLKIGKDVFSWQFGS